MLRTGTGYLAASQVQSMFYISKDSFASGPAVCFIAYPAIWLLAKMIHRIIY